MMSPINFGSAAYSGRNRFNAGHSSGSDDKDEQKRMTDEREQKFQARLAHVIAHENAHAAAAGAFGSAPVINADRASGHVSGHVPIKMDFGKTAEDAERNAGIITRAALAPGDPSSQDRAVAATAQSTGSQLAATRRVQEKEQKEQKNNKSTQGISTHYSGQKAPFAKPANNPFTQVKA